MAKKTKRVRKNKNITVAEAGRMGGLKILELYGSEYFSKIGKKGARKQRRARAAAMIALTNT